MASPCFFRYSVFFPPPLVYAPRSGGPDGSGLALSERSEFSQTPAGPSTAGCPAAKRRGRRHQGRLFFCLLFFWRSKRKVSSCRATPGQQHQEEKAAIEQQRFQQGEDLNGVRKAPVTALSEASPPLAYSKPTSTPTTPQPKPTQPPPGCPSKAQSTTPSS